MQSIGNENDTTLLTAQQLRELTITPEALFERQKDSLIDTFMSSMVQIATNQGGNKYAADLHPKFDPALLKAITTRFEELGYTTTVENRTAPQVGEMITLSVTW